MDTITFPDYKKWYKENNAVWDSRAYGHSQLKFEYVNDNLARRTLKRRNDSSSTDERYANILESMNKIYTKVGETVNQSTDWVHYFYKNVNWKGSIYITRDYSGCYWEHIRKESYEKFKESPSRKKRILFIQTKKILMKMKKKIYF